MVSKVSKQDLRTILKSARPLLVRTAAFLAIFIIFSGLIGPRIIGHYLVGRDGFQVYGGAGKALLFGTIALFIFINHRGWQLPKISAWSWHNSIWLILAVLALAGAWAGVDHLIARTHGVEWAVLTNSCLIASIIFAAGGAFGPITLRIIFNTYKKEILLASMLAIIFYGFLYIIYGFWQVLASIVLHSVRWLLGLVDVRAKVMPPRTLLLSKFGIDVAEYCSGIESIALFTGLYGLLGLLDRQRLHLRRYVFLFLPGLVILFGFNIIRVFILILAGYYINPQIAFSLFHTYAGMVSFIIYSIAFWVVCYDYVTKREENTSMSMSLKRSA